MDLDHLEKIENNMDRPIYIIIKYTTISEAQKKATAKYQKANKEKINELNRKSYQKRKEEDPTYLEKKRQKSKEYYQRKKQQQNSVKITEV